MLSGPEGGLSGCPGREWVSGEVIRKPGNSYPGRLVSGKEKAGEGTIRSCFDGDASTRIPENDSGVEPMGDAGPKRAVNPERLFEGAFGEGASRTGGPVEVWTQKNLCRSKGFEETCRGDWIRTSDLQLPKLAR